MVQDKTIFRSRSRCVESYTYHQLPSSQSSPLQTMVRTFPL